MNYFAMQDNVLDNELKIQQASAMQEGRRQQALNAFAGGVQKFVDEPARVATRDNAVKAQEGALAQQKAQRKESEHAMVNRLMRGIENLPEHQRAEAYGLAVREVESAGYDIDERFESYTPDGLRTLQTVYGQPEGTDLSKRFRVVGNSLVDLQNPGEAVFTSEKPESGFTLSPGQTRFDPNTGQAIASVAPSAGDRKIIKGTDGRSYYADTGDLVLENEQPVEQQRKIVNVGGVPYYADTQQPVIEGMTADQAANFKDEQSMRKEWNALTKDFRAVRDAYTKVIGSAENVSAAGDMALIFNYMKMLDPGSVVREGEFATAQNAAGVPDRLRNAYNNLINGERLNPTQRQDFMETAGQVFQGQNELYERDLGKYREIAEGYGYNPESAVPSLPIIRQPGTTGGQIMIDPQTGIKYQQNADGSLKQVD